MSKALCDQRLLVRVFPQMTRGLFVALVLAGCGGHSKPVRHAAAGPCSATARAAVSTALGVPGAGVTAKASIGNNAYPQCVFRAVLPDGGRVSATANVDTGPQPYFVLERTEVEASQVFTANRLYPAPTPVKLGLEAWWFPANVQLMTTDGVRLITLTVDWHGVKQSQRRAFAIAVARTYLTSPRKSAAKGFPSG